MTQLIQNLITELVDYGIECTLSKNTNIGYNWDIHTGAKSGVCIFARDDKVWVNMRYDEQFQIDDMDDLKYYVKYGMHGHGYINWLWAEFLGLKL